MTVASTYSPVSRGQANMFGRLETITPVDAIRYLETSPGNRRLREHRILRYCRERTEGRWVLHHQGIAFNDQGQLIDGHHRLEMVRRTGLPTQFFVVRNVPSSGVSEVDGMLPRSTRDALAMSKKGDFGNAHIAVASCLYELPHSELGQLSRSEILDRLMKHEDAINFACSYVMPGMTRGVRALLARAYIAGVDRDRLKQFAEVLVNNLPQSGQDDFAALTYGRLLNQKKGQSSRDLECERYQKGQTCLRAFLAREPMTKVYGTSADLFPVPE